MVLSSTSESDFAFTIQTTAPGTVVSGSMSPSTPCSAPFDNSTKNSNREIVRLEDIYSRRKKTDKSQWGTAAPSQSENFKVNSHSHKQLAKRWNERFSPESLARTPSRIKGISSYLGRPGLISLGGGLPAPEYFPFDELAFKVPISGSFDNDTADNWSWRTITAGKHDMATGKSNYDIATAYNYHQGSGSAQLLRWITEHTEVVHNPPYADWAVTMSVGSTSALEITLRMLVKPGEYIVTDEYAFSSAIDTATPMGLKFAGVKMDAQGMLATALDDVLTDWDVAARGAHKPRILYAVPTGHNPTDATQSTQRRREIYAVAQKHDLLIVEDDPYYFLQMDPYAPDSIQSAAAQTRAEFLTAIVPSLLSMDVDGRVVRLDSFSKVVSPGSRVGWVIASEEVVERYAKHAEVSTQGPSGMSQLMLFKLLDETWGHPGYIDWLIHIRKEYTKRRDSIVDACEQHLPKAVVSWNAPMAGMFHWIEVDWRKHPHSSNKSIMEMEEEIFLKAMEKGSLVVRGSWFRAEQDTVSENERMFFRASFAAAPSSKIEEAIRRFGQALAEIFRL